VTPPASTASRPAYDLADKTIYFSYDGADIDSAGEAVVSNFGKYLTANSSAKVRLEGHTDERGSAEYNVALGERRAQSVARALKGAGATDAQLSVVSYGKERPAVQGHDEAAFAKNRRVEITQP
jgi:peptidoglycan-associated lipoprotein